MIQRNIEVLRRGLRAGTMEELQMWGAEDNGFLHLAFLLSCMFAVVSVVKKA